MTEFAPSSPSLRGGMRFKHMLLLSVIAFGGGIGASWWLADSYGWLEYPQATAEAAPGPTPDSIDVRPVTPSPLVAPVPSIGDPAIASGNAVRAEALLVAFAARRAIDNGTPLGYLTDQLRLRFGITQPQAVINVLQASQAPVTVQSLQSELTAIENLLVTGSREETLWATIQRELSDLFVLRKSDSPSAAPAQRMLRTHALVESGNIGGAIAEISSMPGISAAAAQNWLAKARRFQQTRAALDTLERSALALPVPVPVPVPPIAPLPMLPPNAIPE